MQTPIGQLEVEEDTPVSEVWNKMAIGDHAPCAEIWGRVVKGPGTHPENAAQIAYFSLTV